MQSLSWSTQYNKFQLYLYIFIKAIHYITINYTHSNIENYLRVPTVGDLASRPGREEALLRGLVSRLLVTLM